MGTRPIWSVYRRRVRYTRRLARLRRAAGSRRGRCALRRAWRGGRGGHHALCGVRTIRHQHGSRRSASDPRPRWRLAPHRRHRPRNGRNRMRRAGPSQASNSAPTGGSAAAKPQAWGEHTSTAAAPDAAFLIHGLGGTQYDLGSMHKRLKNAGLVTYSLTLPGHGTKPEDLASVSAEDSGRGGRRQIPRNPRSASDLAPDGHVHGLATRGAARGTRASRQRQFDHARAPRLHRRLGHAVVSLHAPRAVCHSALAATDENRRGGPLRHQERAAARDRQGQVRARREFSLPMGSAGVPPSGRPVACDGDESRVAYPLPDAGGARARGRARRACARPTSWWKPSAEGGPGWSSSRTVIT